jgi:N-acylglucosamine 2-epimerase
MQEHELRDFYRDQLFNQMIPFWLQHARDREYGGYHTCLNRDGSVYDYDKACMWHAGRLIWTFSFLYNELEENADWLAFARHGIRFVDDYGFAPDGSMYYGLTREGRPLSPARDWITELSTIVGYAEFARASGKHLYYAKAREMMLRFWEVAQTGGKRAFPPVLWETRPVRWFAHSMIVLNVVQVLRSCKAEACWDDMAKECVRIMLSQHYDRSRGAAFEYVGWSGEPIPGTLGRRVNPGHMIEGGIFLIHEAWNSGDKKLLEAGVSLIGDGYSIGWDAEYGGIFNDVDAEGQPLPGAEAYLADGKLWWQHAEALYGLLLAWKVSGQPLFLERYWNVHEYAFGHFADPEYGEWYAHLDRRGNRVNDVKGSTRKNFYHQGRNFLWCYQLLQQNALV